MNYSLTDLPNLGDRPVVYMDIKLQEQIIGRIYIRLFRDVFPAGVENFARIADGKTYKVVEKGNCSYKYKKEIKRTYEGCRFFHLNHNKYIVSGDIYNNDGTNAGTIYFDKSISPDFGEFYYPHESKGLVSLIPYKDESTGRILYDSTFMITLNDAKPSNCLKELDDNQIVIGQVFRGIEVLDKINELIKPYARRKYPKFIIDKCGTYRKASGSRRRHPDIAGVKNKRRKKKIALNKRNRDCENA